MNPQIRIILLLSSLLFCVTLYVHIIDPVKTNQRETTFLRRRTNLFITYRPGKLNVYENGLVLSKGLTSKIIAKERERVRYANGGKSDIKFHHNPDGGAVFESPSGDGWVYVSNSERENKRGGVGAITFNRNGNVVNYEMILTNTTRNCQGGKTPWKTWISCEENENWGQCYEIDPFNKNSPRKTQLGGEGGNFEAVAIDDRNMQKLKFFVTNDKADGELRRFSPDSKVLKSALRQENHWRILSSPGTMEYLVLRPNGKTERRGTFTWTTDIEAAKRSARKYFKNCEGVDAFDGKLYFASKRQHAIFELDLDNGTYRKTSTKSNLFSGQPDQVNYVDGDKDMIYLSEDGKQISTAGVYGREKNGKSFAVLKSTGEVRGDAGGIAFSPNKLHMYVAFLNDGTVFDITRVDKRPFDGKTLNIRYHND